MYHGCALAGCSSACRVQSSNTKCGSLALPTVLTRQTLTVCLHDVRHCLVGLVVLRVPLVILVHRLDTRDQEHEHQRGRRAETAIGTDGAPPGQPRLRTHQMVIPSASISLLMTVSEHGRGALSPRKRQHEHQRGRRAETAAGAAGAPHCQPRQR